MADRTSDPSASGRATARASAGRAARSLGRIGRGLSIIGAAGAIARSARRPLAALLATGLLSAGLLAADFLAAPIARAAAAGEPAAGEAGPGTGLVKIFNRRPTAIFVGFTTSTHRKNQIAWGKGCTKSGAGVKIAARSVCVARVSNASGSSRFCADLKKAPANCYLAQDNHQTMVETLFLPGTDRGCFGKGDCIWFDISVIPAKCTDALWTANRCAKAGGASYNLPVALACGPALAYACRGPVSRAYGPAKYPGRCGNPDASCVSTIGKYKAKCVNAYFYPMASPPHSAFGPNTACLAGKPLTVEFLPGR